MKQHLKELIKEQERLLKSKSREEMDKLPWDPFLCENGELEEVQYACDIFGMCNHSKKNERDEKNKVLLNKQLNKQFNKKEHDQSKRSSKYFRNSKSIRNSKSFPDSNSKELEECNLNKEPSPNENLENKPREYKQSNAINAYRQALANNQRNKNQLENQNQNNDDNKDIEQMPGKKTKIDDIKGKQCKNDIANSKDSSPGLASNEVKEKIQSKKSVADNEGLDKVNNFAKNIRKSSKNNKFLK